MRYFVTGGSRGIGADIVKEAARQGNHVAFTYATNEDQAGVVADEARRLNPDVEVRSYRLDVKDPVAVEAVADQVLDDFETIEVIVNNAGIKRDNLVATMSNDEWDEVIATNLTGPFYVCRQFLPTLLGNRWGRIINISSLVAFGGTGQANYAASKAGLQGLTQTLAKEYGRKNITANALVLGIFDTDMTRHTMNEEIKQFWTQFCPQPKGRMGDLTEVSQVVCFLASKDASFVNGQIIKLTGGLDWGP